MGRPDNASAPYSAVQLIALRAWARGQRTEHRRENAAAMLGLGIGAGLHAREIAQVCAEHVTIDERGIAIDVVGKTPRQTVVLAEWESEVGRAVDRATSQEAFLFIPNRLTSAPAPNMLNAFVCDTNDRPFEVNSRRMRATWIVTHLEGGTPIHLLAEAAGLAKLEGLSRYAKYVRGIDQEDARRRLRLRRGYAEGDTL